MSKPFFESKDFKVKLKAGKFRKGSKWDNIKNYQKKTEVTPPPKGQK